MGRANGFLGLGDEIEKGLDMWNRKNVYLLAYLSLASYVKSLLLYLDNNQENFQKEKMMDYIYLLRNVVNECDSTIIKKKG